MEYIGSGIFVMAVIAIGVVLYLKSGKQRGELSDAVIAAVNKFTKEELIKFDTSNELVIQIEMLPVEAIEDESRLVEITDSKVLAHVNNLVPGLVQAGNAVNNAAQAVQAANGEVLYRAGIRL